MLVHCWTLTCLLAVLALPLQSVPANPDEPRAAGSDGSHVPTDPLLMVLAGDSTVTDAAGWGAGFAELLSDSVTCMNLAQGGRSSRSFRTEGWWQKCLDLKPDAILIQFGHNDQPGKGPLRESAADGDFREHLRQYIREARSAGIRPILVTPLTRRRWNSDGTIQPTLAEYASATVAVAAEEGVTLIDLHQLSIRQCEQLGPSAFRAFEPMTPAGADHTHLNKEGSRVVAALVVRELLQQVPEWLPYFASDRLTDAVTAETFPQVLSAGSLQLREDDTTITLQNRGHTVLVYNKSSPPVPAGMNPLYQRSGFLHPVMSPAGHVVTATFPSDHPHQHGIFSAWVKTTWNDRDIDFWNLAGGTGRVLHQRVVSRRIDGEALCFEADLIHRAEQDPIVDILKERWTVTLRPSDDSYHVFDLQTVQSALTELPLVLHKYHYGGVAVRGPTRWLSGSDADQKNSPEIPREAATIQNHLGSDRIAGNHQHTHWVAMTGEMEGQPVSITMMSHPENLRAPQAARLHPTKPYFVLSPCVDGPIVIDQENPYRARYRFLLTDAPPDAHWLDQQWQQWTDH